MHLQACAPGHVPPLAKIRFNNVAYLVNTMAENTGTDCIELVKYILHQLK